MNDIKKKNRYKIVDGIRLIEVRVKNSQQLFDAKDPAPFHERDLDDDFVEYILSAFQEFSLSTALKINIQIDDVESSDLTKSAIIEAIQSYFTYKIDLQRGQLRTFIKRAQFFLIMGLVALISCLTLAQSLDAENLSPSLAIMREGIVIFGWVSIWRPIELILFDWYPLYEKIRLYNKILRAPTDIQFSKVA